MIGSLDAPDLVSRARLRGHRSQRVFDALLRTLAEPGTIRQLAPESGDDIPAVAWPALALADVDVPVAVTGSGGEPLARLIGAATGAPRAEVEGASIVVVASMDDADGTPIDLERIPIGTATAPEEGARLVLPVDGFDEPGAGTRPRIGLSGPGVPGRRSIGVGLDPALLVRLGDAAGRFPCGFDTWLVSGDGRVLAIPRSTAVELEEH